MIALILKEAKTKGLLFVWLIIAKLNVDLLTWLSILPLDLLVAAFDVVEWEDGRWRSGRVVWTARLVFATGLGATGFVVKGEATVRRARWGLRDVVFEVANFEWAVRHALANDQQGDAGNENFLEAEHLDVAIR